MKSSIVFAFLIYCVLLVNGSELSTYAKQNCLVTPVIGYYDCDITSNSLLFKQSILPGPADIVYLSQGSGLKFSIGRSISFAGLVVGATNSYIIINQGASVNITGGFSILGGNSTFEIGGNFFVTGGADIQNTSILTVDAQATATFGIELNTQPDSKIIVYETGILELNNTMCNFFGSLELHQNSALVVSDGTITFADALTVYGNVTLQSASLVTDSYTQQNGTLQLISGSISSQNTIIAPAASISGGGSITGNLVIDGTFNLVIGNDDSSFSGVDVGNATVISGYLFSNITDGMTPHDYTYIFLSANKCIGKFKNATGSWFTNTSSQVVYKTNPGHDTVALEASSASLVYVSLFVFVVFFVHL